MALTPSRGFTLLIAVVFMSVLTAIGTVLASFVFKQTLLAATATQSQYAFYAADAALECALEQDQHPVTVPSIFSYASHGVSNTLLCGDNQTTGYTVTEACYNTSGCSGYRDTVVTQISLDGGRRCADITAYKPSGAGFNYIFSQGYNVPCSQISSGSSVVARGLEAIY